MELDNLNIKAKGLRIVTFVDYHDSLDNMMNQWLSEHDGVTIVDIQFVQSSTNSSTYRTGVIIFKR